MRRLSTQSRLWRDDVAISHLVVTTTVVIILVWATSISIQRAGYEASETLAWENAKHDPHPEFEDLDDNGIADIDQNYPPCTNLYGRDSDGDGMLDLWERQWTIIDPVTGEYSLYGMDPTDAIEDPDGDGYDYDGNGRIDGSTDLVFFSGTEFPHARSYHLVSIEDLLLQPHIYDGAQVLLKEVWVVDNGTNDWEVGDFGKEVTITVTDEPKALMGLTMTVVLKEHSWRPRHLQARYIVDTGQICQGTRVDVYGRFTVEEGGQHIEVRGTEGFPNFLEYHYRFYYGDREIPEIYRMYNMTDPMNPDTDEDGMTDGWEARYGERVWDPMNETWQWLWHLDPTYPEDAGEDADGDGWTNLEEFRMGTSPIDASSHP